MTNDPCRFCKYYALSVLALSGLMSAWTALPLVVSTPHAQAERLLGIGIVQSTAPAAAGTALVLALVLWAAKLSAADLGRELPQILKRGAALALPGFLASVLVGLLVAGAALGMRLGRVPAFGWLATDGLRGVLATGVDTALILLLAWRFLARLRAGMPSLAAMFVVVVTVTVPLRVTVALVMSSLLPG